MKVSVIIPSFNHERYIESTINSVLDQTLDDLEIIIVDDGSTDGSRDVIQKMSCDRIRLFTQENRGTAPTLNRGMDLASGDIIAILNSDDCYAPNRLERLIREMEDNPGTGFVFSGVELIDAAGKVITSGSTHDWLSRARRYYDESGDLVLSLLKDNFACTSSNFLFKKELIRLNGGFSGFRYVNDLAFILGAFRHTRCRFVDEPLLQYRVHDGNTIKESCLSSTSANFLYELSWVAGTFLGDHPGFDELDVERLFRVLHETHLITQETVLQCMVLQKKTISFEQGRQLLGGYIRDNMERQSDHERLRKDVDKVLSDNRKLSDQGLELWGKYKDLDNRFADLSSEHGLLFQQYHELLGQHNNLSDHFAALKGHSAELESHVERLTLVNAEKDQALQSLNGQVTRIWHERQDFAFQLTAILNSRRYRTMSALFDLARFRNVKASAKDLLRVFLPESMKERLKGILGRYRETPELGERIQSLKKTCQTARPRKMVNLKQKIHDGPLVSIIVPCYNYGRYIDRMMESLDAQTFQNYEIILVDDGSTDPATIARIKDLEDENRPDLHIFRQNNQGVIAARNHAMGKATGKYLFPLDPDDTIEKTFLEKCMLLLESSPDHYFTYTWTYSLGEPEFIWETVDADFTELLERNRVGFVVFPARAFKDTGGYNPVMKDGYEDWEFCINMVRRGYVGRVIPEPLYQYYVKPGSRNDDAIRKHALLKKIINDLHKGHISSHGKMEKKENSRRYVVTNPVANLKARISRDARPTLMVDLLHHPVEPLTAFPWILTLCENREQRVVVVIPRKWHFFFNVNPKDNLLVYYPENYSPDGNPDPLFEYLESVYHPQAIVPSEPGTPMDPGPCDDRTTILFAAPWLITGGADSMILDWFTHLDPGRFRKFFVTTLPQTNTWLLKLRCHADGIYDLPALGCSDSIDQQAFFLDFILHKNIQILHIMNSTSAYAALPAIKERFPQVKTVSQFHCFDYLENGQRVGFPNDIPGRYDPYIDHYNIEYQTLRDDITGIHPHVSPEKFTVIHGCIDTALFDPDRVNGQMPSQVHGQEKAFRILFIGRLDYQKQPLVMAELAHELNKSGIDFMINVIGDGSLNSQKKELTTYLKQHGLTDKVLLHGNQPLETLPLWYKASDMLLLTSLWEGVPMVLYQAMSMGLPCVAPDVGGVGELVKTGVTGTLIPDCRDVAAYRDAIIALAENPEEREILGRQAMERMHQSFDIATMKQGYEAFYQAMVTPS
ncbi:MAG: glycosyltransferase [Pseudomonadota bacterium]